MEFLSNFSYFTLVSMCNAPFPIFNTITAAYDLQSAYDEKLVHDTFFIRPEYDFIVIGTGSGGSVIANRLTEEPWRVLLLEAGREEMFVTDIPLSAALQSATKYNWGYKAEKMDTACLGMVDGRCNWPRGKAMGGSSVLNFMAYSRGNAKDYDEWESMNNTGWSYSNVLKYFIKSERAVGMNDIDEEYHGKEGYLNVEYAHYESPLLGAFLKVAKLFGYEVRDPNGVSQLGFSRMQATLRNGRRCSASKAYIRPIRNRINLNVAKEAHATKILINPLTKQAYGVEFFKNSIRYSVRTTKEVILSAGTMNSPQLLMLSGIGPKEHLENYGIDVIQDLKVGYNLQDHVSFCGLTFTVNESITVIDTRVGSPQNIFDYSFLNKGPLTLPGGAEGVAFMKFNNTTDTKSDRPDFEVVLGDGALSGDSEGMLRKLVGLPDSFYKIVFGDIIGMDAFSLVPVLTKPKSRGRIMLKDNSPFSAPLMYAGFLEKYEDVTGLIEAVKMV